MLRCGGESLYYPHSPASRPRRPPGAPQRPPEVAGLRFRQALSPEVSWGTLSVFGIASRLWIGVHSLRRHPHYASGALQSYKLIA
eukprot:3334624-Pyramimonas_sp.AAC.1